MRHYVRWTVAVVLSLLLWAPYAHSLLRQDLPANGAQPTVERPQSGTTPLYSSSYALLISASQYKYSASWPVLAQTKKELDELGAVLQKQGFEVTRIVDPNADELNQQIRTFFASAGRVKDARIVIVYSGHGYYDKETGDSYLVPIDAMGVDSKSSDFFAKAYAMEDFRAQALRMPAKHGLFIFDNCYSGVIFKSQFAVAQPPSLGRTAADRWRYLQKNSEAQVRQFISAGGPGERLPPVSIFMSALIQGLSGAASRNDDGYITGRELGLYVWQQVIAQSRQQTPHSDVLGKVMGDMIFQIPVSPGSTGSVSGAKQSVDRPRSFSNLANVQKADTDVEYWRSIGKEGAAVGELKSYLSKFPHGAFAQVAGKEIARRTQNGCRDVEDVKQFSEGIDLSASVCVRDQTIMVHLNPIEFFADIEQPSAAKVQLVIDDGTGRLSPMIPSGPITKAEVDMENPLKKYSIFSRLKPLDVEYRISREDIVRLKPPANLVLVVTVERGVAAPKKMVSLPLERVQGLLASW